MVRHDRGPLGGRRWGRPARVPGPGRARDGVGDRGVPGRAGRRVHATVACSTCTSPHVLGPRRGAVVPSGVHVGQPRARRPQRAAQRRHPQRDGAPVRAPDPGGLPRDACTPTPTAPCSSSRSTGPRSATRWTARPPPRSPTRSAPSTRTTALAVAVLTGAGGTFCAGADLKAIARRRANRVTATGDGPMGPTRMLTAKPVLAAVEGYAVAGGLELACWCDLRIAARDAVFGVFCRRWGVPLIDGGTVRLPRLIGLSPRARPDPDRSRRLGRRGARGWGWPTGSASRARRWRTRVALAHDLAGLPQVCMRSDRRSAYEQVGRDLDAAMQHENELGVATLSSSRVRRPSAASSPARDATARRGQTASDVRRFGIALPRGGDAMARPTPASAASADIMSRPVVTVAGDDKVADGGAAHARAGASGRWSSSTATVPSAS